MDWTLVHVACREEMPHQSITSGAGEVPAINPGESARGLLDVELGLDSGQGICHHVLLTWHVLNI